MATGERGEFLLLDYLVPSTRQVVSDANCGGKNQLQQTSAIGILPTSDVLSRVLCESDVLCVDDSTQGAAMPTTLKRIILTM